MYEVVKTVQIVLFRVRMFHEKCEVEICEFDSITTLFQSLFWPFFLERNLNRNNC